METAVARPLFWRSLLVNLSAPILEEGPFVRGPLHRTTPLTPKGPGFTRLVFDTPETVQEKKEETLGPVSLRSTLAFHTPSPKEEQSLMIMSHDWSLSGPETPSPPGTSPGPGPKTGTRLVNPRPLRCPTKTTKEVSRHRLSWSP